ncbi:MAG: hypothetical protein ABIS10_07700 [Novosphingobium sp.]
MSSPSNNPVAAPAPAAPEVLKPAPPLAKPAPQPVAAANDTNSFAPLALGGVALAGVLAGAALITRRRKPLADDEALYDEPYTEPQAGAEPEPAFAEESIIPAPLFAAAASDVQEWHEPAELPSGPVPTGKERERLIARMAAAPPNADNPFTSTRSRRKRARILLAAHESRQREAELEPFDFRKFAPFSQTEAVEPVVRHAMVPEKEPLA